MKRQNKNPFWNPMKAKAVKNPFWQIPKVTRREKVLIARNPFGDWDKDGVKNIFDCKPFNKRKQGFQHQYSFTNVAAKKIMTVKMPPELFLKTTYGEMRRRDKRLKIPTQNTTQTYEQYKSKYETPKNFPKELGKGKIKEMAEVIKSRKKHLPIPFLTYNEKGKAIGHEGRHTALAAQEAKLKYIPVTIERPKETRLTTKYKTLEPIQGKQYQDWSSEREKGEREQDYVIQAEELKPELGRVQVNRYNVLRYIDNNKPIVVQSGVDDSASSFLKDINKYPKQNQYHNEYQEKKARTIRQIYEDEGGTKERINTREEVYPRGAVERNEDLISPPKSAQEFVEES